MNVFISKLVVSFKYLIKSLDVTAIDELSSILQRRTTGHYWRETFKHLLCGNYPSTHNRNLLSCYCCSSVLINLICRTIFRD